SSVLMMILLPAVVIVTCFWFGLAGGGFGFGCCGSLACGGVSAPPLPLLAGVLGFSGPDGGVAGGAGGENTLYGTPRVSERMRAISAAKMAVLPRSTVTICMLLEPPASPIALRAASISATWSLVPLTMTTLRTESPSMYGPTPVRGSVNMPLSVSDTSVALSV